MTRSLPERPSLENLKKQAKNLLKSHNSSDPGACTLLKRLHRFSRSTDQQILSSELSLAEAQYALAMDYGFPSRNALRDAIKDTTDEMRFLHLFCGDLAAETLRRSGTPGKVSVWYDPLCEGPAPAGLSSEEWNELRTSALGYSVNGIYKRLEEEDYGAFAETVLWFDACLYDQIILIHHLDWLSRQDMGETKLSLVCIGEFPGMPKFAGFGQLRPDQMPSLLEARQVVTKKETDLATRAWNAYRSPDPAAIEELLTTDTTALPYLAPAFRRHLQRFPSVYNGLSRLQQECLEVINQGYSGFMDMCHRVWNLEDPPYFGEGIVLGQLQALAVAPRALLRLEGLEFIEDLHRHEWPFKTKEIHDGLLRKIGFFLTDTGRDVLAGKADHVRMNGIDRWLGGVHLQDREATWRWEQERERLVAG